MLTVSNYHYIRLNFDFKYPSIFGVTPHDFKRQLLLLKNKSQFITLDDLILNTYDILNSNDDYNLITFDDGLKEQYQYALPILNDLNLKAVFFANSINTENNLVSTVHKIHLLRSIISPNEFIQNISKFYSLTFSSEDRKIAKDIYIYDDEQSAVLKYILNFKIDFKLQETIIKSIFDNYFDEIEVLNHLYMSKKEIIDIANLNSLGSHTHSHYPIGLLNENEAFFELENSKKYFEELTDTKIEMVAYPYGNKEALNDTIEILAKQIGYKIGFTTNRGTNNGNSNLLLLNRFDCNDLIGGKNYK